MPLSQARNIADHFAAFQAFNPPASDLTSLNPSNCITIIAMAER